ncbi:MAG TPA: hydroxyacid dehydrogenase [Clostridiaceae bacterium]|nr:hydroxyacid dehydrogenase [Clostridiaceae bacterium]
MVRAGVLIPKSMQNAMFTGQMKKELESVVQVSWNDKDEHFTEDEACDFLKDCEIAIGTWGTPGPSKKILDSCPSIKLWEHAAGTVKHFFTEDIKGRDIIIASCAPAIAKAVAEFTLGELIVGLRRIIQNYRLNKVEKKPKLENRLILNEATIGIIGLSRVGRAVLELLQPLRPRILVYDPYVSKEEVEKLGATKVDSLIELCEQSDAVTLHTPSTKETWKMMGEKEFKAMKDDAVFINTSRGACVDEAALIEELKKGRLFAFLDVSDPEPAEMDSPLRKLPNVIYTSHIAGGGPSIYIGEQVISDIKAYLNGQSLEMQVTWDMLDRIA